MKKVSFRIWKFFWLKIKFKLKMRKINGRKFLSWCGHYYEQIISIFDVYLSFYIRFWVKIYVLIHKACLRLLCPSNIKVHFIFKYVFNCEDFMDLHFYILNNYVFRVSFCFINWFWGNSLFLKYFVLKF